MDAISSGTGTQPVFLKLDWSSLKATTSDNPDLIRTTTTITTTIIPTEITIMVLRLEMAHLEIILSETILLEAANLVLPHLEVVLQV